MRSSILFISIMALMLSSGCKKESELKKSVFIYDTETPGLPAYSEWGYNTFGAFFDRQIFRSSDALVPSKVFSSDTAMQLILEGEIWNDPYSGTYSDMTMTITLKGFTPENYQELVALNDSTIDMKDPRCLVQITGSSILMPVRILSGTFYFKRVQNLSVDRQHIEAILSGYFEFKAILVNDKPMTVSEGRFDVGIGEDNFYLNE
jgi:hypothetical protein